LLIFDVLKIRALDQKLNNIFVLKYFGLFYEATAICDAFQKNGSLCEKAVLY